MTEIDRRSYLRGTVAATGGAAIAGPGLSGAAAAQGPEPGSTVWDHSLGEGTDAIFHGVAASRDGSHYVFVGEREHSETGEPYEWLAVVTRDGEVVFRRDEPQSQPNPASFRDVVPVGDGSYYVVGRTADEEGSYPLVARIDFTGDGGLEFRWRESHNRSGLSHAARVTPDDGVVVVGTETDPETDRDAGHVLKFSPDGDMEWVRTEGPEDLDVVLTDVTTEGVDGVGVCGFARSDDGTRQGVAGTVDPSGDTATITPVAQPEGHGESLFRALHPVPNGSEALAAIGEAIDGDGDPVPYIAVVDRDGAKTRHHFPPVDGSEAGFYDAVRRDDAGETVYIGYQTFQGNRQGWITVFDDEGSHVTQELRTGEGDDNRFTAAVVTDLLVIAGQYQELSSEYDGWAHAIVPGSGDDSATDGNGGDGGSGSDWSGGSEGGERERRQRGFISHDGDDPDFLSNAANLTTIGFLLSVFGIAHQMLKGR